MPGIITKIFVILLFFVFLPIIFPYLLIKYVFIFSKGIFFFFKGDVTTGKFNEEKSYRNIFLFLSLIFVILLVVLGIYTYFLIVS